VDRLAGADRYGTSAAVLAAAEDAGADPAVTWAATGADFADALVAGSAAAAQGGVLALVDGGDIDRSPASRNAIAERASAIEELVLAGGPAAVSERAEAQLRTLVE
jgi:putative cell wall-binding protein